MAMMNDEYDNGFVTGHLALVHSIAAKFTGRGIEYDELFSAGCVGLVKAGNKFDKSRGLCFSTYAVPVIMGEIKQLFRDGGIVKVSRGLKERSREICRLRDEMSACGKEPTVSELARKMGITPEDAALALNAARPALSLSTGGEENGDELDIPIPGEQSELTDKLALRQIISGLSPTDRQLIHLRYWEDCTQSRTAEILGMTQVQVSRREKKILESLRKELIC